MNSYAERTAGVIVEEKDFSLVWHYRGVLPELAAVRKVGLQHDLAAALAGTDLDVFEGNKILEVKPRSVNKGVVARELLDRTKADFIMCAGDDYTDEDMFAAFTKSAWTIKVGLGITQARHTVDTVDDMLLLLSKLAQQTV
jgi:trehalose 6-phosphate synthase/phosphatase